MFLTVNEKKYKYQNVPKKKYSVLKHFVKSNYPQKIIIFINRKKNVFHNDLDLINALKLHGKFIHYTGLY